MSPRRALPLLAGATALALTLAACSGAADATDPTPRAAGGSVTVENAWVKAADADMSAVFGELENTGDSDVTVVSVTSPASTTLQLHETVTDGSGATTMQEKEGGFTIAPGSTLTLEPGGNHIMLMDLVEPIQAGDEVAFTLTFSDDSTLEFTAPAKDYSGANENYGGEHPEMDDQ